MSRSYPIVRIGDRYAWWSTVVDSPVGPFLDRGEFLRSAAAAPGAGEPGTLTGLVEALARADTHGTSLLPPTTAAELTGANRAGPNETRLSLDGLLAAYTDPPARTGANPKRNQMSPPPDAEPDVPARLAADSENDGEVALRVLRLLVADHLIETTTEADPGEYLYWMDGWKVGYSTEAPPRDLASVDPEAAELLARLTSEADR